MKIYWSLESIPELSDLTPSERLRLWQRCSFKPFRHWQVWAALAIGAACAVGALHTVGDPFASAFASGLAGGLGGSLGSLLERNWETWTALAIGAACAAVGATVGYLFGSAFAIGLCGFVLGVTVSCFVGWQVGSNLARPYLRAAREAGLGKAEEPPLPPLPSTVHISEQQQAKTEMPLVQKMLLKHGIPSQVAYQAAGQFRRGKRVVLRVRDADAGRALVAALQGLGVAAEVV